MKLSVLDQSVIRMGETASDAFNKTEQLAKLTDDLGYTRFWVAEHHNTNGLAGTSPEILISHLATMTDRIRIGSGGVLLPQYSPFKIAENFNVLQTLYPDRIDLGIGRSPGGPPTTRLALTDGIRKSLNEFPRQVSELQSYLTNQHTENDVIAYPLTKQLPEMWMLGVSQRGARLAAEKGTAFTFGHFLVPTSGQVAIEQYKRDFKPSPFLAEPKVNVCVFIVCAPTREKAEEIALTQDLWLLAVEKGENTKIPSIEQAKSNRLTEKDKEKIKQNRKRMMIGTPEDVKEQLLLLSEKYQVEEFMVINNVYSFEDKLYTYNVLADMFL
ncbi:LLM class flavin-dependent oxidoreductase [Metabacillus malikii]|uniref:Luciferase family oxidoreductase group 1 n=1 Tax=Metabacillus malikii TaxID=1504265 RepID=A0ABT9ZBH4_9BACI|nr:LLM class flavin-dependent oxidoreductase [Metabacillus malikii]MDQ0229604.1 luciferase family oxidoreductase group 1 [Metabacillus malikii]